MLGFGKNISLNNIDLFLLFLLNFLRGFLLGLNFFRKSSLGTVQLCLACLLTRLDSIVCRLDRCVFSTPSICFAGFEQGLWRHSPAFGNNLVKLLFLDFIRFMLSQYFLLSY